MTVKLENIAVECRILNLINLIKELWRNYELQQSNGISVWKSLTILTCLCSHSLFAAVDSEVNREKFEFYSLGKVQVIFSATNELLNLNCVVEVYLSSRRSQVISLIPLDSLLIFSSLDDCFVCAAHEYCFFFFLSSLNFNGNADLNLTIWRIMIIIYDKFFAAPKRIISLCPEKYFSRRLLALLSCDLLCVIPRIEHLVSQECGVRWVERMCTF